MSFSYSVTAVLKRSLPVAQLVEYTMALKVMGSIALGYTIKCIPWMHYKSLWIKVFVKCINICIILYEYLFGSDPLVKWREMVQIKQIYDSIKNI